ncbi:hypothetical protein PQX77_006528 [Marasmius sp. AFHP31]|nr:hypothetical protein PQX77_006528 [Marasmius sp. AFHP31]
MPSSSSSLTLALQRALDSRARRKILRSLPFPTPSTPSSETPTATDFTSNDYLSLTTSPLLHTHVLRTLQTSPHILGSGGSRLLVNPEVHDKFERRVERFFNLPTSTPDPTTTTEAGGRSVLLFNSGYDANVSFFSTVPQPGDAIVYDELVHASVHDGIRGGCRAQTRVSFRHNDVGDLRRVLRSLSLQQQQAGKGRTIFVAIESLYSMDGTFAPLREFVDVLEEIRGEAYLVVDEAHATGVYGPKGRGRVALEGLEGHPRVLARLCTFGKALGGSGALLISTPLITKYLLNYARPLVYTTALSNMAVIAAGCSFDLLEDGTAETLAKKVLSTSKTFTHTLRRRLREEGAGRDIIRVGVGVGVEEDREKELDDYAPIIPILTPPGGGGGTYSPAHDLSSHLLNKYSILARPITWPTVPKGDDRVRVCLHAGHTREQVERLIDGIVEWARGRVQHERVGEDEERPKTTTRAVAMNMNMDILLKSRL